jgi:hypothetical protein
MKLAKDNKEGITTQIMTTFLVVILELQNPLAGNNRKIDPHRIILSIFWLLKAGIKIKMHCYKYMHWYKLI